MFQNEKWSLPQNHTLSDKWDVIHRSLASECVYTKTRPLSILTIRFVQPKWWWQEHSSQGFKAQKPMGDITAANLLYHLLDKVKTSAKHQHYLWNLESHFYVISGILFKDQTLCNSHHLEVTELGRRCNFQILDRFWHSDSAHMLVFLMQGLIWYIICMNGGSCLLHLLLLWVQQLPHMQNYSHSQPRGRASLSGQCKSINTIVPHALHAISHINHMTVMTLSLTAMQLPWHSGSDDASAMWDDFFL